MVDVLARDRARLLELLTQLSYERRKVVLSSGRESDFYIDCKRTALTAEGHYLIGRLFFQAVRREAPEAVAVGGLTLGADPLASAVSLTSYLSGHPLHAFIVRKEPKGHGTGQWVEGLSALGPGAPVAILEDVVTTGGSTLKAVERAQAEGLRVLGAFALVDRLEGGREAVEAAGQRLFTLFTRRDFP
jgi:orotate phosphoribosyltransferase